MARALIGTLNSYLYGGLTGFWVIDWITFWGLIIFNTLIQTGDFEKFEKWCPSATADIRMQTIMLAWAFGALLEGTVGFGYPWAVVVPILVGLGITDSMPSASRPWPTMRPSPTALSARPSWASPP